jgi:bacteriocin biosynthesis cyclodehydratase domain-containing protein
MIHPSRRPRLALPFSILPEPDRVRLVAGEDFRYSFTAPELDRWLPALLKRLDGSLAVEALLSGVEEGRRADALAVLERLYGERAVVDGPASAAHVPAVRPVVVTGNGPVREALASSEPEARARDSHPLARGSGSEAHPLVILCQDRLDYAEALDCNARCRRDGSPWLWASIGAMQRGYVGPLFLPDAGPCFGCLLRSFQRLSPAPDLYDALVAHSRGGGALEPGPFPSEGAAMLGQIVRWKIEQSSQAVAPPALFRLHVLDCATLEVGTHRVFVDPHCPQCNGGRR